MKINLKFYGNIRNSMGLNNMTMELFKDTTADELVKKLIKKQKIKVKNALLTRDGKSYKFFMILNSKRIIDLKNTKLQEGDVVYFLPPTAGG